MNAPLRVVPLLPIKRCTDCAHYVEPGKYDLVAKCGRTLYVSAVDGMEGQHACSVERAYDVANGCGPAGRFFMPSEAAQAARSADRIVRQQMIVDAIGAHRPDADWCGEIVAAVKRVIDQKYSGIAAAEAMREADSFMEALKAISE